MAPMKLCSVLPRGTRPGAAAGLRPSYWLLPAGLIAAALINAPLRAGSPVAHRTPRVGARPHAVASGAAENGLLAYLHRPEPSYRWDLVRQDRLDGGTVYHLHLVSQVWHGITWEHHLEIFRPDQVRHPEFCGLMNTGGNPNPLEDGAGMLLAKSSGTLFAVLYNIPNQPLYGGRTEDALVVYTWEQFLKTGDDTWPLHFPMAKAVLKSMDAIQEFAKQSLRKPVTSFMVTGASKRGWTTWLVGASGDPRVKGIAPMVIDTLNLLAQIPHQLKAYGKPSEQVGDYTSAGMLQLLFTPRGKQLVALEDPYSYRQRLTLPKLIVSGTNDRYWAQDAVNVYWGGLHGPKWLMYDPNSGHGLEDRVRVFHTLSAFIRMLANHESWPSISWAYNTHSTGSITLLARSHPKALSARLWHVHAETQDFRDSRWTSEPIPATKIGFVAHRDAPIEGYDAVFAELSYDLDGQPYTLSTQIGILPSKTGGQSR